MAMDAALHCAALRCTVLADWQDHSLPRDTDLAAPETPSIQQYTHNQQMMASSTTLCTNWDGDDGEKKQKKKEIADRLLLCCGSAASPVATPAIRVAHRMLHRRDVCAVDPCVH
jgi:hypothetical protein